MTRAVVDTSFVFALLIEKDPHHQKAIEATNQYLTNTQLYANNFIVAEISTLLMARIRSPQVVGEYYQRLFNQPQPLISVSRFSSSQEKRVAELLTLQTKSSHSFLSWFDMSLVVQAREENIDTIITFDTGFAAFQGEFMVVGI